MVKYTIESALAISDSDLDEMLGLAAQRDEFKDVLKNAAKLTGEAKETFEASLNRTLNPQAYVGGLKYDLECAERKSKNEVADVCGCCPRC